MSISLNWLKDSSFPFKIQHAEACLITQGLSLTYHLDKFVRYSQTNEGQTYWGKVYSKASQGANLYNMNSLATTIKPYDAIVRMIVVAECIQYKNDQRVLDGLSSFSWLQISHEYTPFPGVTEFCDPTLYLSGPVGANLLLNEVSIFEPSPPLYTVEEEDF